MTDIKEVTGPRGVKYDLVYSADDNGWYFQRHTDDATSEIYATDAEALKALNDGVAEFS